MIPAEYALRLALRDPRVRGMIALYDTLDANLAERRKQAGLVRLHMGSAMAGAGGVLVTTVRVLRTRFWLGWFWTWVGVGYALRSVAEAGLWLRRKLGRGP